MHSSAKEVTSANLGVRGNKETSKGRNRIEKYSLRQRQRRKSSPLVCDEVNEYNSDTSNQYSGQLSPFNSGSHEATSRARSSKSAKAKTKPAPLSKYRRKTANARERTRMREINSAFETLRHCVPHTISGEESGTANEKLTKITTLRLAMKYIQLLSDALTNPTFEGSFMFDCHGEDNQHFATHFLRKKAQNEPFNDLQNCTKEINNHKSHKHLNALEMSKTKSKAHDSKARKAPSKRQNGANKTNIQQNNPSYSHLTPSTSTSSTPIYVSLSAGNSSDTSSPPLSTVLHASYFRDNTGLSTVNQPTSDLGVLILESDGESLSLSERCLSPMITAADVALKSARNAPNHYDSYSSSFTLPSLDSPLGFSLHLDSPVNSSIFPSDQQPPSCASPLITLDPFNPFSDLLHPELPDQNTLDLFLT